MSQTLDAPAATAPSSPSSPSRLRLHVISHTHWDREWYLSHENFRLLLVDLIDNLIGLLERQPEFRFFHLDGQTIVLEDYLEIRPWMRDRLAKLIRDGRILIGPWYLQNDEFLTDGESTIRNLLIGCRICREDYGVEPMMVGYVPDQFGNISQLPQILNGFGIRSAVFGRGYNEPDGPQEFLWRSPDGSEVLVSYLITWYNNVQRFPRDPDRAIAMLRELITNEGRRPQTVNRLLMNGVDHLEAQENLSAIIREVNAREPEFELISSTLPDYFDALRAALENPRVMEGEMRAGDNGSVLPGTASSRVHLKQSNFLCQQLLRRWVEPFAVFARLSGSGYNAVDPIRYAWKLLIQNHPHDSICGCSIDEVHFQMEARFRRVLDVLRDQLQRSFRHLTASVDTKGLDHHSLVNVFNAHPHPETSVLETVLETLEEEDIAALELVDAEGKAVPFEVLESRLVMRRVINPKRLPKLLRVWRHRVVFQASGVPAVGYKAFFLVRRAGWESARLERTGGDVRTVLQSYGYADDSGEAAGGGQTAKTGKTKSRKVSSGRRASRLRKYKGHEIAEAGVQLENEHLSARFHANGSFDLVLKESGRTFRGLHVFEDVGDSGNEYIFIQPRHDEPRTTEFLDAQLDVLEQSALRQRVRVTWKWKLPPGVDASTESRPGRLIDYILTSTFTLSRGERFVEVETAVNNRVRDHRLRVLFPTRLRTDRFVSDSPFDIIRRPFDTGEANRTQTHTMESFFAVTDGQHGLAVFSAGMPECQVMEQDATMALTLLRCVDILGDLPPQFWNRDQLVDDYTPEAQCQREYTFRYAVYPFEGNEASGQVRRHCERFIHPLRTFQLPADRNAWLGERFGAPKYFDYFEDEHSLIPEPEATGPPARSFLSVDDPHVALAAVKFREKAPLEGRAAVIRLVNYTDGPRQVAVVGDLGIRGARLLRMSEDGIGAAPVEDGTVRVDLTGKQVRTVELEF